MPRGDSDPSRKEKEESGWRHTRRHRLRTLLQRAFRSGGSPPAMSSNCICIAVPLNRRWCSHSAWGQECWQIISQWVWNLRLELGHQLEPTPLLTTEFAPAISLSKRPATSIASPPPTSASGYGPPATATRLGKRAASPALTSLSSPTEPSSAQQAMRFTARSGVEKLTGACAWCMRHVSVTAALAHCAYSVNGRATRRASHARCSRGHRPHPTIDQGGGRSSLWGNARGLAASRVPSRSKTTLVFPARSTGPPVCF